MRQCIMRIPTGHQHIIACKARATSPAYCPEKVISSQDHTINCPSHWLLLKREKKNIFYILNSVGKKKYCKTHQITVSFVSVLFLLSGKDEIFPSCSCFILKICILNFSVFFFFFTTNSLPYSLSIISL